ISSRSIEHFSSLLEGMSAPLMSQSVDVAFYSKMWDAADLRSSSRFIDAVVELADDCDQVFLLVSNFSDALEEEVLGEQFQHFLSQFSGRVAEPSAMCWIEPTSNRAERVLSAFQRAIERLITWLRPS